MAAMMDIDSGDEETLRKLAGGGTMDYSTWPLLLTTVVSRIEKIARNDFPIPRIPQPSTAAAHPPPSSEPRFIAPLPSSSDPADPATTTVAGESGERRDTGDGAVATSSNPSSAASSQETNKENAAPAPAPQPPTSAPVLAPEAQPSSPSALELDPGTLPPQITAMLAEITGVLNESFHTYPPHTIQRLAELVLDPRAHYRSLPAYLHAVDRVVHVTSGDNIYPLPPAVPDMTHMTINGFVPSDPGADDGASENGADAGQAAIWASTSNGAPIGSDEALGGALLTPIPWLARRAANGDGGSESGESSTLGSDGGPSPLAAAAGSGQGQQRQAQGRQFEMQVRTESTETIDGPNGMGSIETVSVINGISSLSPAQQQRVITQGELIRQEQRAGVVPVTHLARSGPVVVTSSPAGGPSAATADATGDTAMGEGGGGGEAENNSAAAPTNDDTSDKSDEEMPDDEAPHARGPDLIGAEDMGPQTPSSSTFSISGGVNPEVRGIDVEAAVGRKHEAQVAPEGEGAGAAAPSESSSADAGGVVPTPTSPSESEVAPEARTGEDAGAKEGSGMHAPESKGEAATQDAEPSSGTATSGTLTASPSPAPAPAKREAEDDIAEVESVSSKRLKGSPPPSGKDDAEVASVEAAKKDKDKDRDADAGAGAGAGKEGETTEPGKDGEGDIVLPDEDQTSAPASGSNPSAGPAPEVKPAAGDDEGKGNSEEGDQAAGAKPAHPAD